MEVENNTELSKLDELLKEIKKDATEWETKGIYKECQQTIQH
jgi:prephenate dehydratase